ncbi:MAG: ATP-binding protein [Leptolyngbyaceae cyanobacterium MO_188.B28]|nr:ATP-binding protein [Leptolyngbyaceae cyanobacterium MO_188.B28]
MLQSTSQALHYLSKAFGIDQSISKKISFGYTLALGTAVLGASCGLLGGSYYAQPTRLQAQQMLQEKALLNDLNTRLLSIQMHPQRLLAVSGESAIWLQYETNQFSIELRQLNLLLDEIEQVSKASPPENLKLTTLISQYRIILQSYDQFTRDLWDSFKGIDHKQAAAETLAAALSSNSASELSTLFEQRSEDLTRLQQMVDQNYNEATSQLLQVERLRLTIILASMAASVGLGIVLAMFTSRAIARPIEKLTMVAHRVTQDNNFHLQAPIQTRDEVSLLAQALNQLVSWAGQYTAELEEARQTLEKRVEERTQALQQSETSLRQQAEDLQGTLDALQKTQLQLIQSEKMSSLGQMVAGVAHEINNPVSFIYGNLKHAIRYTEDVIELLELYQSRYPTPNAEIQSAIEDIDLPFLQQDFPKLMQSMEEGAIRIRDIVQSLRTFSRLDESAIKQVDLHDGIDSTLTILNNRLKTQSEASAIQVIRNYGQLPAIECYAGQLNQVFMNILSNTIDAFEMTPELPNPTITITTQTIEPDWVAVQIKDNGPGIPESVRRRLFDPFFTTKTIGKGTGLGLSISYQVVTEKHKGYLGCESIPGQGAEFIIKLPVKL